MSASAGPEPSREGVTPTPRASVVVATYNRQADIVAAIGRILDQNELAIEVIVSDDASTDDTAALVAAIADDRVRLVRAKRNGGPAVARNRAIAVARGEIVFFTDDDVEVAAGWVAAGLARFAEPDLVGVEGRLVYVADGFRPHYGDRKVDNVEGGGYLAANAAYRRSTLEALGGFDSSLRISEDLDLAMRAKQLGRVEFAPEMCAWHRRDLFTTRSFFAEARKAPQWLGLTRRHGLRRLTWGPIYEPVKLLALVFPPLILLRLAVVRVSSRRDVALLCLAYPRLWYERVLVWRWAVRSRTLLV